MSFPEDRHTPELGTVQETLLVPLWARACESRQRGGLLDDPQAIAICKSLDYNFRRLKSSWRTRIGCVLRTLQFDDWTRDFLRRHPAGFVVELGVGLNTRFERTGNGRAGFLELDLPDVIALRRRFFEETPLRRHFAADVTDPAWLAELPRNTPLLFVVEGVLTYLAEDDVRMLFERIATRFPGALIAFDALTTRGLANLRQPTLGELDAAFCWGIDEIRQLESWGDQFACLDAVNLRHVALRNRRRLPWRMLLVAAGMATIRRRDVQDYWLALYRLGDG